MGLTPYTEDALVQQPTVEYLEKQLGWESVYAHNKEDFGPNSLLGRACDREVVLTRILREKLAELNPGLPDAAYDDAVRQMTALPSCDSRVAQIICSQNQAGKIKQDSPTTPHQLASPTNYPAALTADT